MGKNEKAGGEGQLAVCPISHHRTRCDGVRLGRHSNGAHTRGDHNVRGGKEPPRHRCTAQEAGGKEGRTCFEDLPAHSQLSHLALTQLEQRGHRQLAGATVNTGRER